MAFEEQLLIMSGEQSQRIMQDIETMMSGHPYHEIGDNEARIATLCELNNAFADMYDCQSEARREVIDQITDTMAYSALRAVMPPNRRSISVARRVAVGTTHRGLVRRSKDFGVYSRIATEQLLFNTDTVNTDVTLTQSFALGSLAIEGHEYTFSELGPLLDVALMRARTETGMRFLPLANLAIFDAACPEALKEQNVQTVTNLITLMAEGATAKAV